MAFQKLSAKELQVMTTAFAKQSKAKLQQEISQLERSKAFAIKRNPNMDPEELEELDYYIGLRKGALK